MVACSQRTKLNNTMEATTMQKKQRPRRNDNSKKVCFSALADTIEIPSRSEMTQEQKQESWLQCSELSRSVKATVELGKSIFRCRCSTNNNNNDNALDMDQVYEEAVVRAIPTAWHDEEWVVKMGHSSRGLEEICTPAITKIIKSDKANVIRDVLLEQDTQQAEGEDDPEEFAFIANEGSKRASEWALLKALRDEQTARKIYAEEKCEEFEQLMGNLVVNFGKTSIRTEGKTMKPMVSGVLTTQQRRSSANQVIAILA